MLMSAATQINGVPVCSQCVATHEGLRKTRAIKHRVYAASTGGACFHIVFLIEGAVEVELYR